MSGYDFRKLLADGYRFRSAVLGMSRGEYLSSMIFGFVTYDGEQDETFAARAVEVCAAISDRETFDYIADADRYHWYLVMVNTPFFRDRIEWGTSVRGAWWDHGTIAYGSCGLFNDDQQVTDFLLTHDEWCAFVDAIRRFAKGDDQ